MFVAAKPNNEEYISPLSTGTSIFGTEGLQLVTSEITRSPASSTTLVSEKDQTTTENYRSAIPSETKPSPIEDKSSPVYEGLEVVPSLEEQFDTIEEPNKMHILDRSSGTDIKGEAQLVPQRNHYQLAKSLQTLQRGPGPVDCPICSTREVTTVNYVSGNYTT